MPALETIGTVIITAIVIGLVNEGIKKFFRKDKLVQFDRNGKPLVFITQGELDEFCSRRQDSCAAKQMVSRVEVSVDNLKNELKAEIKEVRSLVIEALRKDNNPKGG